MLRSIKIRQYLSVAQAHGIPAESILADTRIDHGLLSDPSYMLSMEQCHVVASNIIKLTQNKSIGLIMGRETTMIDLGIVGYAMTSSSTLRQTMAIWLQHVNSPLGWPVKMTLTEKSLDEPWEMTISSAGTPPSLFAFYCEEIFSFGFGSSMLITGEEFKFKEISFTHTAPKDEAYYENFFCHPVKFNAPECKVSVFSPKLDIALRSNDDTLNRLCLSHCGKVLESTEKNGPTTSKLRGLLLRSGGRLPTIGEVADELAISPRTLRRHLISEGTGYQKILDEFRFDLAKEYLASGLRPKEVAYLCGFKHTDAFRQAFKIWAGENASAFRRKKAEAQLR